MSSNSPNPAPDRRHQITGRLLSPTLLATALSASLALASSAASPAPPTTARSAGDSCCAPEQSPTAAEAAAPTTQPAAQTLRIDADANNLPFTNAAHAGFENRLADLLGTHLGSKPEYIWRAQRRGFFKHALKEGEAQLVLAVPAGFDMGLTTKPYYRSSYCFVYRKSDALDGLRSLDDPRLKNLKIGIQFAGDDGANPPPAHALGARGLANNLVCYNVLGDYREPNPPARVMKGLGNGEVDVAVAWGPVAGYFASELGPDYVVVSIAEEVDPITKLPMTFDICMAVRHGDTALHDRLNAAIDAHRDDITALLRQYHVPLLPVRELPREARKDD